MAGIENKVYWGLRWLDRVFQGQYLPSLYINYVAINKDLETYHDNCIR